MTQDGLTCIIILHSRLKNEDHSRPSKALRGNPRDFTNTQLLNLVNLANKTETLVVEGPNETAKIAFRDGKLAYAQIDQEDSSLASVLHKGVHCKKVFNTTLAPHASAGEDTTYTKVK